MSSSPPAGAAAPADLPLTQEVQLLAGRLTVALPAAMQLQARDHSIMAAETSGQHETRAVLHLDQARFVMMTYELFALTGGDFRAAILADKRAQGEPTGTLHLEPLPALAPLTAIAELPPPTRGDADANLVYAVWIGHLDATVQLVAFDVNPEAARDAAGFTQLARNIALTLKPGTRALDTLAGEHTFGRAPAAVTVTTPDGWTASLQPGPDFTVYHLHKLVPLGAPAVSCGIYLGRHGAYQFHQHGIDPDQIRPSPGKLFGTEVTWLTWTAGGSRHATEVMVSHPSGTAMFHAFCSADTEAELTDLRRMIETIQVPALDTPAASR